MARGNQRDQAREKAAKANKVILKLDICELVNHKFLPQRKETPM